MNSKSKSKKNVMNNLINIIQLMQNIKFATFSYQGMKNPLPHGITFMLLLSTEKEKSNLPVFVLVDTG